MYKNNTKNTKYYYNNMLSFIKKSLFYYWDLQVDHSIPTTDAECTAL